MSADAVPMVFLVVLSAAVLAAGPGRAAEPPAALPSLAAAGPGPLTANSSDTAIAPPDGSMAPPAGGSDGAGEPPGDIPAPAVLRDIGQRQSELAILELDLKRAELQKKLRELENPPLPPVAAAPAAGGAAPPALESAIEIPAGPMVRRIHKTGDGLAAVLLLPGGEIREVRRGAALTGGLTVVAVEADGVFVRQGGQAPFALPVANPRHGGQP